MRWKINVHSSCSGHNIPPNDSCASRPQKFIRHNFTVPAQPQNDRGEATTAAPASDEAATTAYAAGAHGNGIGQIVMQNIAGVREDASRGGRHRAGAEESIERIEQPTSKRPHGVVCKMHAGATKRWGVHLCDYSFATCAGGAGEYGGIISFR